MLYFKPCLKPYEELVIIYEAPSEKEAMAWDSFSVKKPQQKR